MSTRKIVICAVTVALMIAIQFALSFVAGVELVTVFFLCFCYTFGAGCGMLTATSFSLLRCLLFGFSPNVLVLYLVYYNLFAAVFGIMGKKRLPEWCGIVVLLVLATAVLVLAIVGLPISVLYVKRLTVMLWILFSVIVAITIFDIVLLILHKGEKGQTLVSIVSVALLLTVVFTLLDDIITPLFAGMGIEAAMAYVYVGFLAMLPQTVCVAVSTFLLFYPLKRVFELALNSEKRN